MIRELENGIISLGKIPLDVKIFWYFYLDIINRIQNNEILYIYPKFIPAWLDFLSE